ncbi:MAG: putative lipid II flippase FtsW [Clostridiales Family XIII bacterium]|jgi:cell division protein FtsW|nr:putative lipid II flippase FtsW [Clostridiales Family XIII bacterium]
MNEERRPVDAILLIVVICLTLFGVIMVFSASYYSTISGNKGPYQYLLLSIRWAIVGAVVMTIASFIPYRAYYVLAPAITGLSLFLLAILYIPGVGQVRGGATRWLGFGEYTFMPGEFAKFAAIVFVAWFYTKYADKTKQLIRGFLPVIVVVAVYFVLIYKEPNLSTALIIVLTMVAMIFLAGVPVGYILGAGVLGGLLVWNSIQSEQGEHSARIAGFLDPFADAQGEFYQTVQGLLALGSGGLVGVGLGNSVEKALWLPEAQNDFIFAIIGEETGFVGCILLIFAYIVLIWRCLIIAMRAKDRFGTLLGGGIACIFALQSILNIAVVTSMIPPTGVILPFVSYGGNAIVLFMLLIGVMLNISKGLGGRTR